MIRLYTLGAVDLRNAEGSEIRAATAQPKRLALLAFLGVAPPHGFHRRDTILALFWPERDNERARASLNRAIYFLRRELGAGILNSRGDEELGLDGERFWCDAAAFDEAFENGRYGDAFALYRGELLPGFFVSDAPGFDEWLEAQRTRLRERASHAAWRLAGQQEAAGDLAGAAEWAQRGVALAPFREAEFRRLLALLDRAGDRAAAAHAYAKFAGEIARDLDVSPSPETRTLIDTIRARTPVESAPMIVPTSDTPVIGESTIAESPETTGSRYRLFSRRSVLTAAAAVAVLATISVALTALRRQPVDPLRVDVAPWENRSGDHALDRLGVLAADGMVASIRQAGLAGDSRIYSASAHRRAGTVVAGAFERSDGMLRVQVWVNDVRRGRKAWPVAEVTLPVGSAEQAIDSVRSRVVGAVAVLRNPSYASVFPVATAPPAFDAYQEFVEGVRLQSEGLMDEAVQHFRWSTALDTRFTWPLVYAAMASLYWPRADLTRQVDSLLTALSLARNRLTPLQSHLVDHISAVRTEDWGASYRAIRAAATLAPQQYGFLFAGKATQANRPREAVDALTRPGMDSAYRGSIQGYWYTLTLSLHHLGEHRSELEQARRARAVRPQSGSAAFQEIRALVALGRIPAVRARLDTLMALPRDGWLTPGMACSMVATELRAHGQVEAAADAWQRALAWYRSRPIEEHASQEWRELVAEVLYGTGDWARADSAFQSLDKEYPSSRGYPDNVMYLGRLGTIAARRGDVARAKRMAEKLKAMEHPQPVPGQDAIVFRARIAALLGAHDDAMRLLTDAYGAAGTIELHGDIDFESMREYAPFQEFVRPKP